MGGERVVVGEEEHKDDKGNSQETTVGWQELLRPRAWECQQDDAELKGRLQLLFI